MMNRRAFFATLAAAVAGANYDPERALWTPGKKRIFIPSPALPDLAFHDAVILVNRAWIDYQELISQWAGEQIKLSPMPKIGDTVQVRRPVRLAKPPFRDGAIMFEGGEVKLFTFNPRFRELGDL